MGSITERFEKRQIELDLLKNVLIQRLLDREPEETRIDPSDRPLAIGDKVRIANDIKQHQERQGTITKIGLTGYLTIRYKSKQGVIVRKKKHVQRILDFFDE